jgi:hypothetical protein
MLFLKNDMSTISKMVNGETRAGRSERKHEKDVHIYGQHSILRYVYIHVQGPTQQSKQYTAQPSSNLIQEPKQKTADPITNYTVSLLR